jgi:citrate synthase
MPKRQATEWIEVAEAAARLGVKPATLYAYVSRGVLRRRKTGDGRRSLFDPAEVEELARKGRPRRPPELADLVIESAITAIAHGRLYYRGSEATAIAATRTFEEVAAWLWTGAFPAPASPVWRAAPQAVAAGTAAASALPAATLPLERLQVIVPALAAADPLRLHLDRPAVVAAGQAMIAGMVDCLPAAGPAAAGETIAERLWASLCPDPPEPALLDTLRTALVLLADHELAASTLAVRIAASARADPYACVATGLGAVGGALHGGASLGAEVMLGEARDPADAPRVIGELLRRGQRVPGLGHTIYKAGDPRAEALLDRLRAAVPRTGHRADRLAIAEAVLAEAERRRLPPRDIDLVVAALVDVAGMVRGSGEAIFAVARTAGWLAHALEQYERGILLRPRASYVGPELDTPT